MSEEFNERQDELEDELSESEVEKVDAAAEKSPAKTVSKSVPAKKKVHKKSRIARWFREMRSELKKVVWPTPKQVTNNTLISLVVMVASGVVIWALDFAGTEIVQMLITLGS